MSFSHFGLADGLLRAVHEKGYTSPSPIQEQAIPAVLEGRDLMAAAQTGTGKTASFTLPLLQRLSTGTAAKSNHCRALVLTPTRELAAQVGESISTYGQHLSLRSAVVYGGVKINPQMMTLRKGVDVLVATPGRLLDLYQQNAISFKDLEILVLDEADRMLDMGFINDIRKILALLPSKRQSLLFSATFSPEIRELAKGFLLDPQEIDISPRNTTADTVDQWVHTVDKNRKAELLSHLITTRDWRQALVFTRTKHGANKLVTQLAQDGIRATAIHGNKSQGARTKALEDFKTGRAAILVATDIAARGLDIIELPQVVNFDLPNVPEDYVHRIGRTGRAGAKGRAISLVSADEFRQLWDIERLIGRKLVRDDIKGFEPEHVVPESKSLKGAPPLPKKPKRKDDDKRPARPAQKRASPKNAEASSSNTDSAGSNNNVSSPKPMSGRLSLEGRRPPKAKPVTEAPAAENRQSRPRQDERPRQQELEFGERGERPAKKFNGPRSDKPFAPRGDRPYQPRGDRPPRDRPQGDRPQGDRPQGERFQGERPQGDRPQGGQARGDKPYNNARPDRSYAASNGDGRRSGPTRGDSKPYPARDNRQPNARGEKTGDRGDRPYQKSANNGKPGGSQSYGSKPKGRYEGKPAYAGVYQPVVAGATDYRTEQRLQSFGNRADIPPEKLKALDERKPHHKPGGSGRPANNNRPKHPGPKKPYAPRDRY